MEKLQDNLVLDFKKIPRVLKEGFEGHVNTIEEFWSKFIEPRLPKRDTAIEWHRLLMDYIKEPRAVFAIRYYHTDAQGHRRGFLTKINDGRDCSYFYADNEHAKYYFTMCLNNYVPSVQELIDAYTTLNFPLGRSSFITEEEKQRMALPLGKDPGIGSLGYKLSHIIDVGGKYRYCNEEKERAYLVTNYFPSGEIEEYTCKSVTNDGRKYNYRSQENIDENARNFLIAEFLRYVHPFNYFLSPQMTAKTKYATSSIVDKFHRNDVGEHEPVQKYVQEQFSKIYGSFYDEFLDRVMPVSTSIEHVSGEIVIDLTYSNKGIYHEGQLEKKTKNKNDGSKSRDFTKFTLDSGSELPKSHLVLAVVKDYVENHEGISYESLQKHFLPKIQGSHGIIKKYDELNEDEKKRRFFTKQDDLITLQDGTKIAVCTQWGASGGQHNFETFLAKAKELGYGERIRQVD